MATRVCVLDGGGPKDSENTLNSFLTKRDEDGFWQIGTEMIILFHSSQQLVQCAYQDQFVKTRFPRIWSKMS